ncbi:hypothetical protein H2203_001739 [Taxawa tesnikishii (nom. ined.)]|nr:hypothetical protein H2203_001739 [Dothideales sp. JES 119]
MIFDVAYNWYILVTAVILSSNLRRKHSVSVEATIAADVEKIVAGFKASSGGNAHQAEADREPGFNHALHKSCKPLPPMLCVADVVTLVDALYPEEKPQLFTPANLRGPQTPLSSASSVSGLSAFNDSGLGDMSSVSRPDTPRLQSEKEHGCLDPTSSLLRQACTELTGTIGPDAALGKVGPFLENWMPFPKPANATRTVQHRHRASENYPAADMSNPLKAGDLEADLADLDTDYLQMRSAVLGLVEEFAVLKVPIPSDGAHDAGPGQGTEETQSANPFQRYGGGTHHASSNPFRRRTYSGTYSPLSPATDWTAFGRPSSSGTHPSHADEVCDESLTSYMERAVEYYQREGSFTKACYYSQTLERIRHLSDSLTRGGCAPLVNQFTRDIKRSIERSQAVIEACEGLLTRLVPQQEQFDRIVEAISEDLHRLREKMWYAVDVRVAAQYEDLKGVVSALQTMCPPGRGQRPVAEGLPTARQRGAFKPSAQWAHLKTPAAVVTLDIMAVAPDYGGPNKLGNEQAQLTRSWMEKRGIENLCKGEERIHRFCLELNRCINNLISESPVKSPVLWSSELFQHERYQSSRSDRVDAPYGTAMPGLSERYSSYQATGRPGSRSSCGLGSSGRADPVPFALRHKRQSVFPIASTFQPPGMQDYFGSSSPTLTNKSSTEFWSPVSTEIQTPSSITSGSSRSLSPTLSIQMRAPSEVPVQNRYEFLTKLRESLTSLLISDLGNMMFPDGCETDVAMWDTLSGRFAQMISGKGVAGAAQGGQSASLDKNERQFGSREAESRDPQAVALDNRSYGGHENFTSHDQHERESKDIRAGVFNSEHASRRLIGTFAMACNPFAKLKMLHELQSILTFKSSSRTAPLPVVQTHNLDTPMTQPREEFKLHLRLDASGLRKASANTDTAVSAFRDIFRNPALRPRTLFRDMQYVASLVPMDILETSPEGKAFWNAAIAALSLKEEICRSMMELTDQIILYQTSNRGHSHTASAAQQQRDAATFTPTSSFPIQEDVSQYSMADAAQLLQITAKDGDPVAQRELATLYLTHPDLMNRVIAPMTRPQDVFKDTIERRWKDPDRYDPMTMCVAHHWMELSAKGGDALAAKYLKAKDEMERIP